MKESSALKQRELEVEDEDDWPAFELNRVVVLSKKNESIDLLDALVHGPFTISGKLQKVDKEFQSTLLKTSVYNQSLVLENVGRWSLQENDNGGWIPKIWALGYAGWYLLSPSAEYSAIFNEMCRKGAVWLFIEDNLMNTSKKVLAKQEMETLYRLMAKKLPELGNAKDMEGLVEQHRRFLISNILTYPSLQNIYKDTLLWRHLSSKYKPALKEIRTLLAKKESDQKKAGESKTELLEEMDELQISKKTKATRSSKPALQALPYGPKSTTNSPTPDESRGLKRKYPDEKPTRRTRSSADDEELLELPVRSKARTPEHTHHSSKGTSVLRPSTRTTRSTSGSSPLGDKLEITGYDRTNALQPKPVRMPNFILRDKFTVRKTRGLVKLFDENGNNIDDLRVQALSKLSHLHATYAVCQRNWTKHYDKYRAEYEDVCEWRSEHNLQPIYIDINHINGHELGENVLLERVEGTEYLIDTYQWDFETAQELLLNVNRGAYPTEPSRQLQPVRVGRQNINANKNNATPAVTSPACRRLKLTNTTAKGSKRARAAFVPWRCAGYDENGSKCDFVVEDATGKEGSKSVARHWQECAKRRHQSEEMLRKKQQTVVNAHNTLQQLQLERPQGGIDNLLTWLEAEARKTVAWSPPEQF